MEEKEVRMDMYEEEHIGGIDPLVLALQGFEQSQNDKNKLLSHDNKLANGYVNSAYQKDTYESTDIWT